MEGDISGFDFVKRATDARTVPEPDVVSSGTAQMPPFFQIEDDNSEQPFVEKKVTPDKVAPKTHYKSFSKVCVIWKSWESCKRCKDGIENGSIVLPDPGEWTCPHTDGDEYKRICDKCLNGDGLLMTREFFNVKRGDRCVHVEWVEGDPEKLREIKLKQKEKRKNQVYPPDVAGAFAAPDPKKE